MPWDTEATRRRLLDAGSALFAERGFAGTSMETIGRLSGVNKERVYQYFGSKSGFFAAVLDHRLSSVLDGLPFDDAGVDAVVRWSEALFDRFRAAPELARLLAWESLELPSAVSAGHRAESCAVQVAGLQRALDVDRAAAEQLLLSLVTLVTGWWTLRSVAETVLTADDGANARRTVLRSQIESLTKGLE